MARQSAAVAIAAARAMLGVPFRHQGRTLRGIDCIGLLVRAMRAAGFDITDRTDYGRTPGDRKLAQSLVQHFGRPLFHKPVRPEQLQPGDIVAMSWGLQEAHVGLVTDHPHHRIGLIHSLKDKEKVVEHGLDALVASKISLVFRPEYGE